MSPRRALVLLHAESLIHARPGDLVVTDIEEVRRAALAQGVDCVDVREVISGDEDFIDRSVSEWRDRIDTLEEPEAGGVPLLGCLRGELVWEVLFPFARYATLAQKLASSVSEIATDASVSGVRRAAIEEVLGEARVASLPRIPCPDGDVGQFKKDWLLPPTHKPVIYDAAAPTVKKRLREAVVEALLRASRTAAASRPRTDRVIVYGHYRTLGGLGRELGKICKLILWPWALPRTKDITALSLLGAETINPLPPERALRELFRETALFAAETPVIEEAVGEHIPDRSFQLWDLDVTASLIRLIAGSVQKYAANLATRIAAARVAIDDRRAGCVVIPNDTSLDFAALARTAKKRGVPVVVVAHGLEASTVPGDKRLASDVLCWSPPMSEYLKVALKGTGAGVWITGPPHLSHLSRKLRPRRNAVLFLSYPIRHNTAWDSWMDAERYLRFVAAVLNVIGDKIEVVGVKIHPSEDPAYYRAVAQQSGLRTRIIDRGWVHDNLADAGLVVGPISTGLAEAYYLGSMPVCVNLSGGPLPPPCDGSTEIPIVERPADLEELLSEWVDGRIWPEWTPKDWPAFGAFVGAPEDADKRGARIVEKLIG